MRRHYWQYEVGLRKMQSGLALRFGSAWARAMEARFNGMTYEEALIHAIPEGIDLDIYSCEKIASLLAAYWEYYGDEDNIGSLYPEEKFAYKIDEGFTAEGKLDCIGKTKDGRSVIIECKTTGDSVSVESDYWIRLRFNVQLYQYLLAARHSGWEISNIIYDVTRKPSISPKVIFDLDSDGFKIIVDTEGNRVFGTKGPAKGKPLQSENKAKGYTAKQHIETPTEYSERLFVDAKSRPAFYFRRAEFTVLQADVEEFENQRSSIINTILVLRQISETLNFSEDAWPRNVSIDTCKFCEFKGFCLQNIRVDSNHPPEGFEININPELKEDYDTTNANEANTSTTN